ncbi:MAG: hypothetical protein ACYSUM_00055 [Planctomycetota bacterium]
MKRSMTVLVLPALLLLGAGVAGQDDAARAPAWALTFTHVPLEVHSVTYKDGSARSYYYLTFKVENKSQTDADLALHFTAVVGSHPKKRREFIATPEPDAEESVRRLARAPDLKNVQQINQMGKLAPGKSVRGIAVFGTFNREWDVAYVTVSGLESTAIHARVRKFGAAGFTMAHRGYHLHNQRVLRKAGKDPEFTEVNAIVKHDVIWKMKFHREGDEYAPHLDPIYLDAEGWDVVEKPPPTIVTEKEAPFGS